MIWYNTCIECYDCYDEVTGSDNLVKCVSSSGNDVTPIECLVDDCEISEEGLSDQCVKCNSSLVLTPNKQSINIAIEIPEGYENITFKVDENTENKAFDIPPSSSSVTIKLDPSTQALIIEAADEISIESTGQNKSVNINQIKPNSDLTITPKSSIEI